MAVNEIMFDVAEADERGFEVRVFRYDIYSFGLSLWRTV